MQKWFLILGVCAIFLWTGCSSRAGTPVDEAAAQRPEILPTKAVATQSIDTLLENGDSETIIFSECTVVSSQPELPTDLIELFTVSPNDWVTGPEDAAVTLIEYGDFQ